MSDKKKVEIKSIYEEIFKPQLQIFATSFADNVAK